jgi:uncharacterized membrane protein
MKTDDLGYMLLSMVVALLFVAAYFLPALNARRRGHPQAGAILMLDLFLGWTVLGWVGAMVWSATAVQAKD